MAPDADHGRHSRPRAGRLPRRAARLRDRRFRCALGPVGRRSARRAGGDIGEHLRVQPPCAGVCGVARRAAKKREAPDVENPLHVQGSQARTALEPEVRSERAGHHGPGARSLRLEHRLHLTVLSALRRDLRRSVQFVGPSLTIAGTSDARDEQAHRAAVVYVSLGTLFNADAGFYRACFEAFGQEDIEVVMSIGTNVSEASLGEAPANFFVRAHVPQLEVLGRASAFVTHGGMNSVSESLLQGVPVVVIPQMGEQEVVGRRVEEVGAGIYLAKQDVSAEKLRESVARLLGDVRFREQAAVLRDSFGRRRRRTRGRRDPGVHERNDVPGDRGALIAMLTCSATKVWMDATLLELRLAARSLMRTPVFTLTAILTLALGIGANTAIFSVAYGILWRPLPYHDAQSPRRH